ncbi:hypothetical protein GF312_12935 [Candidatus Poribacteria bacterium]|nr:hypothetical protein [Candidatus Poribacteria bacterium]
MIRNKADLQLAMVDLDELLMADDTDMSAVEEKIMSMAEIKAEMAFSGIKTMVDAKSVLTEEQKMKLKKLIKEHEKSYIGAKAKKTGSEDKHKMYGK